jgi:hypothetical protein
MVQAFPRKRLVRWLPKLVSRFVFALGPAGFRAPQRDHDRFIEGTHLGVALVACRFFSSYDAFPLISISE